MEIKQVGYRANYRKLMSGEISMSHIAIFDAYKEQRASDYYLV